MTLFNITSATTTTLFAIHGNSGSIDSIKLTNTDSANIEVRIYLEDSSAAKTYLYDDTINSKTTVFLDDDMSFDNRFYALKLQTVGGSLSASTPLSVIIK